ncbi:uncharacterized protein QC763_502380 [Podospora pseudopauciseta]|uniref:Histone chaperone RTT106/FACT complex subunit SPT16-like middle domain-containing protein n=1 Tax=Podospora pseudopauciseta TaxID=2093780 RepID=A0ABR0H717_9PEZI|nr:hypothetical protein QC763_502380 [Podospora pseudopauciseta]
MPAKLNVETLQSVFQTRPDILAGIQEAADTPARVGLFNEIASFVYERIATASDHGSTQDDDGPAAKRRRVDIAQVQPSQQTLSNGSTAGGGVSLDAATSEQVLLEVKDISASAPQRKKYDVCFTKNFLYARVSGSSTPVQGIVYPWKEIEHIFYLPVPEKSTVQHNYVVLPRNSYLPTRTAKPAAGAAPTSPTALEPFVFTVPGAAPKPGSIGGASAKTAEAVSDSYSTLFHWALATSLKSAGNHSCSIVASDPKLFHSVTRQAHRPTEKAVHVKAFRGSKDGYLFFLPTGILWGFKKPIVFLPLDRIAALSFTSVLARTFNIVVELDVDESGNVEKEIEFGMLDKEDFEGINANYVQRHGLADKSMAEKRKAKRELAENNKTTGGEDDANGTGEGEAENAQTAGMTELEKAQWEAEQQLQDEEDEDEEDYDPGSEGESEGSGTSSEEEDDDEDAEGGEDDDDDENDLDGEGMDED